MPILVLLLLVVLLVIIGAVYADTNEVQCALIPWGLAFLGVVWFVVSALQPYKIHKTTYCIKQETWDATYIVYTDQYNEYQKIPVGGTVPAWKVIEYSPWYFGIWWAGDESIKPKIVPVESLQEFQENFQRPFVPNKVEQDRQIDKQAQTGPSKDQEV